MALEKVTYIDNQTVISAENMNAIQDAIIKNEGAIEDLSATCVVTYNLVNATSNNYATVVTKGDDFSVQLTAVDGHAFTSFKVIHNGEVVTDQTYNNPNVRMVGFDIESSDGVSGVQGDIFVIAIAEPTEGSGSTGENGADGFSPIATVTQTDEGATISITDKNGTTTATVTNGKDGAKGDKGDTGPQGEKGSTGATGPQGPAGQNGEDGTSVTVKSVSESSADGGSNVVTFSDGKTVTIKNGSKGSTGATGPQGPQGPAGSDATVTVESITSALGYVPVGAGTNSPLTGKKIVYDGDSICAAAFSYPKLIADKTACIFDNQAVGGGRLCSYSGAHSVVDNLPNLPADGDLYCFQGGINDFWANTPLGTYSRGDYTGTVDATTIYGALETIFRYALTNFFGKAICFVITHKIKNTMYTANTDGKTFWDYREAMINVCEKYSIPYYDAFAESGLNGWHSGHVAGLFVDGDGIHPTETAYEAYYVPRMIQMLEQTIPVGDYEAPAKPVTYENVLKTKTVDASGNPYNGGTGIKENYYLDGSSNEAASTNYDVTGFIPITPGDIVRLKNVQVCKTVSGNSKCQIHYFKSDKAAAGKTDYLKTPSALSSAWAVVTNDAGTDIVQFTLPTSLSSVRWIRLCCGTLTSASVITINEEID